MCAYVKRGTSEDPHRREGKYIYYSHYLIPSVWKTFHSSLTSFKIIRHNPYTPYCFLNRLNKHEYWAGVATLNVYLGTHKMGDRQKTNKETHGVVYRVALQLKTATTTPDLITIRSVLGNQGWWSLIWNLILSQLEGIRKMTLFLL